MLALDWHKQSESIDSFNESLLMALSTNDWWDWLSVIQNTLPREAAQNIVNVADWAVETFDLAGINSGEDLTLVGHSLGAYLAATIGDKIDNTKNLVALDPAWGNYDIDVNTEDNIPAPDFNQAADNSLSLVDGSASSIGNLTASSTADVSFLIDYPWTERLNVWGINIISTPINPVTRHTGVVSVFQDIVERDLLGDDFTNWQIPPFVENHYNDVGRHEGKIHVDENFKITRLETARGTYWEN